MQSRSDPAVVLLSGGLDSATALAIAIERGFVCHALTFDYGQRHRIELEAARRVGENMAVEEHRCVTIDLNGIGGLRGSALTDEIEVPKDREPTEMSSQIPVTYVPARNTIFLAYALAYAEIISSRAIFVGVNAIDYSGYPDCRPQFIKAFERLANLATKAGVEGHTLQVHTPLIDMTKVQIIKTGLSLGVNYGLTHSCYDPDEQGRRCQRCDACQLREAAFTEVGMMDPGISRPEI